jgi:phospholipid/cholesterol/gamma-HCH transport system substrate-binding protein
MSNIGNKYKVGVFVVAAAVLLIMSLTMLGVMNYFKPKYLFMTVLDSSVQGLEVGAKVKIKGVTIGKVTEVQIGHDGSSVYVYMEFIATSLKTRITDGLMTHDDKYAYFKEFLSDRVEKGLRCQLHYSGITGTLYQELGLFDPKKHPIRKFELPSGHPPYVPSVQPVLIGDILKNLNRTLNNAAKLNLGPMIEKFETLASSGTELLNNKDLKQMMTDLSRVMENLDVITAVVKDNIDKKHFTDFIHNSNVAIVELNKTLIKARKFMDTIDQELKAAEVGNTAGSAREFMDTTGGTIKELRGSLKNNLDNLTQTINSANATLRSAKNLLNSLEQNPSSVIYGKDGKRVIEP